MYRFDLYGPHSNDAWFEGRYSPLVGVNVRRVRIKLARDDGRCIAQGML